MDVTFKPTQSEYSFSRLVNAEDIERYGPISDVPRHAATGNTGRYDTAEVAQMAFDLASSAAESGVAMKMPSAFGVRAARGRER